MARQEGLASPVQNTEHEVGARGEIGVAK